MVCVGRIAEVHGGMVIQHTHRAPVTTDGGADTESVEATLAETRAERAAQLLGRPSVTGG